MTEKEAFKFGFVARCVRDGVNPQEIPLRIKQATEKLAGGPALAAGAAGAGAGLGAMASSAVSPLLNASGSVLSSIGWPAIAALGLTPMVAGGTAAYLKNKALDTDDSTDIQAAKAEELIDTYQQMTERLKQRRREIEAKKLRSSNRQVFL
jgi:hypothetical protein